MGLGTQHLNAFEKYGRSVLYKCLKRPSMVVWFLAHYGGMCPCQLALILLQALYTCLSVVFLCATRMLAK